MLRGAARTPQILRYDIGAAIAALGAAGILEPQAVQTLGDALNLLRAARVFLTLLFDGVPDAEALAGPAGATLAHCVGAVDFPRLDADISAACAGVLAWYDRLVAVPAQQAIQSTAAQSSTEGGVAK